MSHKGQRTVYRLTIVKGYNEEEIDNYAKLVELGKPDFIEIKGVTYCGTSKGEEILLTIKDGLTRFPIAASTLTMDNVPWHEEIVDFVEQLVTRLPQVTQFWFKLS